MTEGETKEIQNVRRTQFPITDSEDEGGHEPGNVGFRS